MAESSPKISFVIPAYNEEYYINGCLDALTREIASRTDTEIIVADNNSTDRTREIVARYPHVKLVVETRRGANQTRQTGFEAAHGELIAFLDADVIITPGWIARAEGALAKDPNLVCISGPFIYYDLPMGIRILVRAFYGIAYFVYVVNNFIVRKTSVIQGGNYMVRRSALEKIGGQNVDLSFYGDDADLALRLSKIGKVRFTFKLPILSSGRRLAKEGAFTMGLRYGINYFWVAFFQRPFTKTATEVRLADNTKIYKPENKKNEWIIAISFAFFVFVLTGFIAYGIYRVAESETIQTISFVEWKLKAQHAIQHISSSTQNMVKEIQD
jgi:glycosyltransferase involved in cell wall biosynthesis